MHDDPPQSTGTQLHRRGESPEHGVADLNSRNRKPALSKVNPKRIVWMNWQSLSRRHVAPIVVVSLIVAACCFTVLREQDRADERAQSTLTVRAPTTNAAPRSSLDTLSSNREATSANPPTSRERTLLRQLSGRLCSLPKPLTVLCIGDSITYGNGSHVRRKERDHEGNYPLSLESHLRSICNSTEVSVVNLGSSGKTLLDGFKQSYKNTTLFKTAQRLAPKASVMILMLGTNDSKPRHWKSKDAFAGALVDLVDLFSKLHDDMKFVLVTPPPSYADPRAISKLKRWTMLGNIRPIMIRNDIRMAVMSAAERAETDLIDLFGEFDSLDDLHPLGQYEESVQLMAHQSDEDLRLMADAIQQYFHDGVHPTLASHEYIASVVAQELTYGHS